MLEGLEISEIPYSRINAENRYDSEYYQKVFLKTELYLKSKPNFPIGLKFKVTDGEHGSVIFQETGIRYLGAENIKKGYVDISNIKYVTKEVDERNARARVQVGDILISIKGTLGEVAVAEDWLLPANMSRDVAIIKPLTDDVPSEYLSLFLMSKYGALQSLRGGSGGVQQMITLERLRKFTISMFSKEFFLTIKELYNRSQSLRVNSKKEYTQAEIILLNEIGIQNIEPSKEPVNIKSFKESFLTTKRLDAEYYQKKYDDYSNLIYKYRNGFDKLVSICNLKDNNFNPSDSTLYKYIELSNIGKSGEVNGCTEELGRDLPSRARRLVNTGDVVISSIEGSLQSCAIIPEAYDNALCSTGFYVINSEGINSETLLVLFKSEPLQAIMKQNCSGTILTAVNKDEFLNIPIPLIDIKKQDKITDLVEESFKLKTESERLLEVAKKAVEIAIETDEATAIKFIKDRS